MYLYAKYCPVAATTNVIGDFWTPLIVRELLYGTGHFNQLVRNLPGISRTLLARRLRAMERGGLVIRESLGEARNSSHYRLTGAGRDLKIIVDAMDKWGSRWGTPDTDLFEVDPLMAICMLKSRMITAALPEERVVIEVVSIGSGQAHGWLVCERKSVSLCADPPGFEINLWVRGDASTFYAIWLQSISMEKALASGKVTVDGPRKLVKTFLQWFDASAVGSNRETVEAI